MPDALEPTVTTGKGDGVPMLSCADAVSLVARWYGLTATAGDLPSERDQNLLLRADTGDRYVLKIANFHEPRGVLEVECATMAALADTGLCPRVLRSTDGHEIMTLDASQGSHFVRLISALPGVPLGTVPLHTDALRRDVGRAVALIDARLALLPVPAAAQRDMDWDLTNAARVVAAYAPLVRDLALRDHVVRLAECYARDVVSLLPTLRRSLIHGDANDYNVLVDPVTQTVSGVIDFGDMVVSHTVNDLAIAMAYVALGADNPLHAAAHVVAGYHASSPLTDNEIAALFSLMCMRLCTSVVMAARQQADRPAVAYLGISQQAIARTLPRLAAVHPRFAHYVFRHACGLPPVPHAPRVIAWLTAHADDIAPLLGMDLRTTLVAPLDFSAGSSLIASDPVDNAPSELDRRVRRVLAEAGATVGAGGYDEARLIYHWPNEPRGGEPRTIHMGLDLSLAADSPLCAPLDGIVFGFENADAHHDYGPVIVLQHRTTGPDPVPFYTLYGHLTRDSLVGLQIGQPIARGVEFARVGRAPGNGDWWEHVHVQLITDMLDVPCNVDGAVRASERAIWHGICPDPNLLLRIPVDRLPATHSAASIAQSRHIHIGGNLSISYGAAPLNIVRGAGQYLFDEQGHRFIDAYNNVAHVGHGHPRVVRAVAEQLAVLNTNTRYLQWQLTRYAESLTALLPSSLSVCFFTASGSEANELALRLARAYTEQRDLIVMESAYHGHTTTLIDISPYKHAGPGGAGAPAWVHTSPIPDVYRARDIVGAPGPWFAEQVGQVIEAIRSSGRGLCGYIAETCPSVGGQIMMPEGFLADVYARVRAAGGLCIADEVQTGFGRIGTHFWAFEQHGVTPDIVVLGKPIANGYPMGAVVTTRAIADAFNNGMEYFSTFGGSTAACVAAEATLRVTIEEGLQAHALAVGTQLLSGLRSLADDYELVGDVRGAGLFCGVELVRDRETREPAASEASMVVNAMRARGILAGTDGPHHNVIKLRGPMPLSMDDAEQMVAMMRVGLRDATVLSGRAW